MSNWITDRTQSDVNRVKEITEKAKTGTWSEDEQQEWFSGMKGALSYLDYNRIESGIQEIADVLKAHVSVKTDWTKNGYMTTADSTRWINNVRILRERCNAYSSTPSTPQNLNDLYFSTINQFEQILLDVETLANDYLLYCSEPFCESDSWYTLYSPEPTCGGEPYYALC